MPETGLDAAYLATLATARPEWTGWAQVSPQIHPSGRAVEPIREALVAYAPTPNQSTIVVSPPVVAPATVPREVILNASQRAVTPMRGELMPAPFVQGGLPNVLRGLSTAQDVWNLACAVVPSLPGCPGAGGYQPMPSIPGFTQQQPQPGPVEGPVMPGWWRPRRRRINPLNVKALVRAGRRLGGFQKIAKKVDRLINKAVRKRGGRATYSRARRVGRCR